MGLKENKDLVLEYLRALALGDGDLLLDVFATDGTVWLAGSLPMSGTHSFRDEAESLQTLKDDFPEGIRITPKRLIAEGDWVAAEAESYGRHSSGKVYANQYVFLFEIRNGKVRQVKEYLDTMHVHEVFVAG